MIAKLRGLLDSTGDGWAILDVNGVGYMLFCGARTLASLPARGEVVEFNVETHVREDHIHLYGFTTDADREMFRILTKVQGVGAKVGLAILSALSSSQVTQAIVAADISAFKKIGGVGPKLASRLITELKDKLSSFPLTEYQIDSAVPVAAKKVDAPSTNIVEEAVSALVNLGYGRTAAFSSVTRAVQNAGEMVTLPSLIKESLRELGSADG